MIISFNKYQGAGNDFVLIKNIPQTFGHYESLLISRLCDRHFGIGADGLILTELCKGYDFRMIYFNSDGSRGTMCGNGARCAAHFAMCHLTGFRDLVFMTDDGPHSAKPLDGNMVEISLSDTVGVKESPDGMLVNTGVPHLVIFTDNLNAIDVTTRGRALRFSPHYSPEGVNVNFVQVADGRLKVRTYERGVEEETLACGTGVTASAIAAALTGKIVTAEVEAETRGGMLKVRYNLTDNGADNIYLTGAASFVYSGEIEI